MKYKNSILQYSIVMIFNIIRAQTVINENVGYIPASKPTVNGIMDKINNIVKLVQSKAMSESKDDLLNNIERKLMKAAKALGPRGKKHVDLIMEGIRIKTSNIADNGRKSNDVNKNNVNNQSMDEMSRNIDILIKSKLDKFNLQNNGTLARDLKQSVLQFVRNNMNSLSPNNTRRAADFIVKHNIDTPLKDKSHDNDVSYNDLSKTTAHQLKSQTAKVDICNNVYNRICSDVKSLNAFKCLYDDVTIPLEKLCDDNIDCPDRSDEKYCNTHVMNKVEFANRVMMDVESSLEYNCFDVDVKRSSLRKHTQILQDVLRAQLNFKEKYENFSLTKRTEDSGHFDTTDNDMVKRSTHEIALIISSLALALNGALCFREDDDEETTNDIFETNLDQDIKDVIWPPKSCECKKEFCSNCTDACKRICWHKHSLTRWTCESISNTDSVTMNAICDGKLDCFDESDEKDCVLGTGYAKFEAHEMYGKTIKMIESRASKENTPVRMKYISLSNMVVKLQELSTKSDPDLVLIKRLRSKCYSLLSELYSDILNQSHFVAESEDAYIFLLSINKNLTSALKRSHTGNNRIISDGCYCRHGTCVVSYCPRTCVKACSVESKITKYKCQEDNASVAINEICDGIRNCPNGYDELECQKEEICRRHHLIVLRHRLQEVGKKFKGTSLGELIQSWKIKVISTLKIAEKSGRPKPQILRKIIKDVLRDLVLTYGSVEDYRRSNKDYALHDFIQIAQQVMSTLKSCGK